MNNINLLQSAGIIVYRKENKIIQILLCKAGGPYYTNTNRSWGIPKGLVEDGEDTLQAAQREFQEETNLHITKSLKLLGKFRVTKVKEVTMYYVEENVDIEDFQSNTFEMEYPKNSGNIQTFFENDKVEWVGIEEAKERIFVGQIQILEELKEKIKRT